MLQYVGAALVCVALSAHAASPQTPVTQLDTLSRIDSVFAQVNNQKGPGCSVGIGRDNVPPILKAYGLASIEYAAPNTISTRFDAASMAKQFTAASIVLLARQGKLSLDDDIRQYIPQMPSYGHVITIRNLINHTSGIRDDGDLLWLSGGADADVTEDEDVLLRIFNQRALNFTPGSEFVYSNSGYSLLAAIVAKVTGKTLREFAQTNIFTPLGMTSTDFIDDRFALRLNTASGYRHARSMIAWGPSPYVTDTYGAGGLFTTAADILKWYASFADRDRMNEMLRRSTLPNGDSIPYAMGLEVGTYRRNRYAGHGGNDLGASTYGMRFIDRNLSIVVLCNARDLDAYTMARQVAGIFLSPPAASSPNAIAPAPVIQLNASQLAQFAGLYFNPLTVTTRKVDVRDGRLLWARGDGTPLDAISLNRFRFPGQPADLFFPDKLPNKPQEMHVISGGSATIYYKADPFVAPRAGMKEYEGTFYSSELETTWHVTVKDSTVHVATLGSWGFDTQPVFRDAFAVPDAVIVRFIRDKRGRITEIVADMPRTRGVRFIRLDHGFQPKEATK